MAFLTVAFRKLFGTCMETSGKVDVVSRSGAVFHKTLLFSFVLNV